MSKANERPVSRTKINLAKKALLEDPYLSIAQFHRDSGISRGTARMAIISAREELDRNDTDIVEKAKELRSRQQEKALNALDSQLARLDSLPDILQTLRNETFEMDPDGEITGIKERVKAYSKDGKKICLTPAALVNEYLEAEKRILEEERKVTGIEAAEKSHTAAAGKTEFTLQLPISPKQAEEIKPI